MVWAKHFDSTSITFQKSPEKIVGRVIMGHLGCFVISWSYDLLGDITSTIAIYFTKYMSPRNALGEIFNKVLVIVLRMILFVTCGNAHGSPIQPEQLSNNDLANWDTLFLAPSLDELPLVIDAFFVLQKMEDFDYNMIVFTKRLTPQYVVRR